MERDAGAPAPKEKNSYLNAIYRYSRGLAFSGLGKVKEAKAERERMEAIAARIPETEMLMINSVRSVLSVGMADLDARIARARKDSDSEIANLQRAVELEDQLSYMEPPEWHYPVREALGGALLRAGNFTDAEETLRKDLEQHPRNGRSLFGLLEALKAQQKTVSVEWVSKEFGDALRDSTFPLHVPDL